MNKKIIIPVLAILIAFQSFAQDLPQLPIGTCGIVNIYDASGNRTKRVYFCNNGIDPYPLKAQHTGQSELSGDKKQTMEFQYVDALYPNPTTGKFYITFSKNLNDANISITDNNGKKIITAKATGYKVDFDLSPYAAGIYFVRIEEDGKIITKKVIKQ